MDCAILSTQDLDKSFMQGANVVSVLKSVTVSFEQGVSYAIIGVSGTGKSTFMHLLAGLDVPSAGCVLYNGTALGAMDERMFEHFLNQDIGLVFQFPYIVRELSVLENVMMPGLIAGTSRESCEKRAKKLLADVGIPEKADHKPASLSGGQQQRVALARALFNNPKFLIADEPTGNLDGETGDLIIGLLNQLQRSYHMGIILSTHDMQVADRMDYRLQLHEGILRVL